MFEHLIKRVLKKKITSINEVYEKMPSKGRYPADMVRLLENAGYVYHIGGYVIKRSAFPLKPQRWYRENARKKTYEEAVEEIELFRFYGLDKDINNINNLTAAQVAYLYTRNNIFFDAKRLAEYSGKGIKTMHYIVQDLRDAKLVKKGKKGYRLIKEIPIHLPVKEWKVEEVEEKVEQKDDGWIKNLAKELCSGDDKFLVEKMLKECAYMFG